MGWKIVGDCCPSCGHRHGNSGKTAGGRAGLVCRECCRRLDAGLAERAKPRTPAPGGVEALKRAADGGGRLPTFCETPDRPYLDGAFGGIEAEVITYRRTAPKGLLTDTVTLHASPDVKSSTRGVCAMNGSMRSRGFDAGWAEGPARWPLSDVPALDVDGCADPDRVHAAIVDGAGLLRDHDVLLYGAGHSALDACERPGIPIRAGRRFGPDGICMLHSYVRHRDSPPFWAGFYAWITERVEACAAKLLQTRAPCPKSLAAWRSGSGPDRAGGMSGCFSPPPT